MALAPTCLNGSQSIIWSVERQGREGDRLKTDVSLRTCMQTVTVNSSLFLKKLHLGPKWVISAGSAMSGLRPLYPQQLP
jgi:hypothetical protein